MATTIKSPQEYYDIYENEVKAEAGDYTDFSEGSMHDIIAGSLSIGMNEISELVVEEFKKTFFDTASGPEVTQGPDDLATLAVDHFGDRFARPEATKATADATFSRPTTGAGDVVIAALTVIKTEKDSEGKEISFETIAAATLTGLTLDVAVRAKVAGSEGNVDPTLINVIETTLSDPSVTVSNAIKAAGGDEAESDANYRETIRSLIASLAGATKAAIKGALEGVPEIEFVYLIEIEKVVIEYDIGAGTILAGATYFRIPYPVAYVADQNGNSSQTLIDLGVAAIEDIRACGVKINILGATSQLFDWTAAITLNPGGPNFAELSSDPQKIIDSMINYINVTIPTGSGFVRSQANTHILNIWGPSGTNDLTQFVTNLPTGDVAGATGVKLIANTVVIA